MDDRQDRRQTTDKFAHCRTLWEAVIANCKANYKAGPVVTIDEQLLAFRGRCNFRMYIPNKPAKYGIKVFMVCDADTLYCLNAFPYLGKGSVNPVDLRRGVNQGQYWTMKLLSDGGLIEEGRSACCDNWFTSMNLARALQAKKMHLVGTIRPKAYLPEKKITKDEHLEEDESVAIFQHHNKVNVVYKRAKKNKVVCVLTTVHNKFTYVEKMKTEAHMFYNASKGGVDAFDKMCADTSVSRKTNRWPMCVFYGIINLIVSNSWIIYKSRPGNRNTEKYDFLQDMAYNLARPHALARYQRSMYLPRALQVSLKEHFNLDELLNEPEPDEPRLGRILSDKRQRCKFCHSTSRFSGRIQCNVSNCRKSVCNDHSAIICKDCFAGQQWN